MKMVQKNFYIVSNVFCVLMLFMTSFIGNAQVVCSCNFDRDGDGISECFDKCPNTTKGIFVDSHGCPRDTDGDGVADYKDHELITPTECQPTDSNGVGYCEHNCPNRTYVIQDGFDKYSVLFLPYSYKLEPYIIRFLESITTRMYANPNFKMVVQSNCGNSIQQTQLARKRIDTIIEYLTVKKHIDKERFISKPANGNISDFVIFRGVQAGEEK